MVIDPTLEVEAAAKDYAEKLAALNTRWERCFEHIDYILKDCMKLMSAAPAPPQTTVRISTIITTPNSSRSNSSSTRLRGLPGNNSSSSSRKRVNNYSMHPVSNPVLTLIFSIF